MLGIGGILLPVSILILRVDDQSLREQAIQNRAHTGYQAAAVATQIHNQSLDSLFFQLIQRLCKLICSYVVKGSDGNISNLILQHGRAHCLNFYGSPLHLEIQIILLSLPNDTDDNLRILLPLDLRDYHSQIHPCHFRIPNLIENISGQKSGFHGWPLLEHAGYGNNAGVDILRDLHPDAAVAAIGGIPQALIFLLCIIGRIRVTQPCHGSLVKP